MNIVDFMEKVFQVHSFKKGLKGHLRYKTIFCKKVALNV